MKPDSTAFLNVNLPAEGLPWPILAIILLGFFGLLFYIVSKAQAFTGYASGFPSQKATVIFGLAGFTYIVVIGGSRLALGMAYPDGYDALHWLVAGALGFGAGAGVGKHMFSVEREQAKAEGAARVAAATPPSPTQVLATEGSSVSVQTSAQPATPARPAVPQAGVKPKDRAVVAGVEAIAANQRANADDDTPEAV